MRFRSKIILNIPQYYFHMAAILKNGCHFFPAEYRQGCPPRSCAGRSPEHVDTQHVFTTARVRWTPKMGFCPLGMCLPLFVADTLLDLGRRAALGPSHLKQEILILTCTMWTIMVITVIWPLFRKIGCQIKTTQPDRDSLVSLYS